MKPFLYLCSIKLKQFISIFLRNRVLFINKKRIHKIQLLNVGCGNHTNNNFINLNYHWHSKIDICWDITRKKIPFDDNSLDGLFSEHCLDQINLEACQEVLKEFYRVLKYKRTLRIVLPDGEMYMDLYIKRKKGQNVSLPYEEGYVTPMHRINLAFTGHGHLFLYDYETIHLLLKKAGFKMIRKQSFGVGGDERLLIDTDWRAIESFYVEAVK